ncbi:MULTISPECIES: sensor histidine kinase [Streptomyces]|uniref:Two-component sensor histidine kinase n=1 Tax=Streptomyces spororaveus TaxID=284039 RepID=A0ABQ3TA56_9ACTN|nr:sensor histidine kinase [Streptomyces spororaveus]MCM9082269.1 sensor histidine kinase [Streptomyces spororaveus]GHI77288.1 two-component sensor histidine kinase [Streptomyces spororaveus]
MSTEHRAERATDGPDHAPEAETRWFGLWDALFAVSYAVTTMLLFTSAGEQVHRAVAMAALTVAVPWYAALGRSTMIHESQGNDRRRIVFSVGLFVLFAVAVIFDLAASFALFAVVPMLMMSLTTSPAIAVVTLANLTPVIVVWLRGGTLSRDILAVLPTSLLGIALSVMLGLWITRVTRQSRGRAALIEELHRNREKVARLSRKAGVSAERERLAREIHDTLAQGLTSIISLVQAAETDFTADPQLARSHLALAGRVARESLAEAREFVTELTPPALQESSLVQATRRQAEGLTAQTGMRAHVTVEGDERELPMAVSVVLLRSLQEAIANIRKHAGEARTAEIRLVYRRDTVRLLVRDDGPGFTVTGDQRGNGLRGMQTRAHEISGVATVVSSPGQGTTIEVTVPVPASGEEADEH